MERWPLVGRTAVAARLRTLVAAGRGAVVTGPAGVGKTALVGAVAREVEPDAAVVVVRATETAGSLPFGAFAPLLPAGDAWPRGTITETFVLRQVARSLAEASAGRPLAVVVDDAQFLDDPSAALVHYLATSGEAAVVATTRAGQHVPDAISDLWVAGILDHIELASLTEAEIEEVLVAALGGPVAPATIRQFARRSAGNPLFLRELLQGALDADAMGLDDGEWHLRGALRPSPRLTELIRLRLDHLDASEQELLQLVAVHEPLGAGALAALSRRETADSLADKGVVTVRVDGRRAAVWCRTPSMARSRGRWCHHCTRGSCSSSAPRSSNRWADADGRTRSWSPPGGSLREAATPRCSSPAPRSPSRTTTPRSRRSSPTPPSRPAGGSTSTSLRPRPPTRAVTRRPSPSASPC